MRPSCQDCARKHLAQASVLIGEAHMGYPDHHWLAIGHLAEAAEELLQSWPDMANQVRAHRKRLELDGRYQVPVMDLIRQIGTLPPAYIRNHTVTPPPAVVESGVSAIGPTAGVPAQAQVASGCAPCDLRRFAAEQAPRYQAEQQEIGEPGSGKPFIGRLIIITTLGNFDRSYSLTSVIIDQAKAAVLAGLRVDLWVNRGCDLSQAPALPYGATIVQAMPPVQHTEDVVQEDAAQMVLAGITALLDVVVSFGPVSIIAHDLLLQSWFVNEAMALHHLAADVRVGWWHMAHSSVNNRLEHSSDPAHPHWLRSHLPKGHRLLAVNASDVQQLAHYYHTTPASIDVLPNSRDPLQVLDLPPEAVAIATAADLLRADVVQIMPCSADRLIQKGALELVRVFRDLARMGADARLVFVLCNCRDDRALQQVALVRRAAMDYGLPSECLHFSHELVPDSAGHGLSQASIRGLFALSNLFAFPTVSEAASLVVWEAMLAGCLMVLNENLPCMMEQLPRSLGLWMAWPSHKAPGAASPTPEQVYLLAEAIQSELHAPAYLAKRHALHRTSLGRYAGALRQVLGLPEPIVTGISEPACLGPQDG